MNYARMVPGDFGQGDATTPLFDLLASRFAACIVYPVETDLRSCILQLTHLTASAGVSTNKFLAKMASGLNKPNGMAVILPDQTATFVADLPVERFHGIGQATAAKLHALGIHTGADLRARSLPELIQHFGKVGQFYYHIARGEDPRPVVASRVRKSISVETSYDPDLVDPVQMQQALKTLAQELSDRRRQIGTSGYTLTLKVMFANYQQLTRSLTQAIAIDEVETIQRLALQLWAGVELDDQPVRLLGLGLRKLTLPSEKSHQLVLNLSTCK